ncbi:hypothetical protein MCAMS1_00375 [biofilm metagenome]
MAEALVTPHNATVSIIFLNKAQLETLGTVMAAVVKVVAAIAAGILVIVTDGMVQPHQSVAPNHGRNWPKFKDQVGREDMLLASC